MVCTSIINKKDFVIETMMLHHLYYPCMEFGQGFSLIQQWYNYAYVGFVVQLSCSILLKGSVFFLSSAEVTNETMTPQMRLFQ